MVSYIKRLEKWGNKIISSKKEASPDEVRFFRSEIAVIQNERMAHLIVTMFVGLFLLLSFGLIIILPRWETIISGVLLVILFFSYIRHYFLLENGLQKLYELCLKMENREV